MPRSPGSRSVKKSAVTPSARTDAASLAADAEHLHRALEDFVRVYQFRDRDRICCHDISVTQCHALEVLVLRGPCTLNELAEGLYLDKSTTSRVVDALERKAFVTRQVHPEDARARRLDVTSAGRALHARIEQDLLREEAEILAAFPHAVRVGMAEVLTQLTRAALARLPRSAAGAN